jgi:hypothetical protein
MTRATRRYRPGFSPEELTRGPLLGTCLRCGGILAIYPAGAACRSCSPAGAERGLRNALDRQRVAAGHMPASELLSEK